MNSGELRHDVTILQPVDTRDAYGGLKVVYRDQQALKLKFVSQSGVKADENHEVVQNYNVVFFGYYWLKGLITERHLLRWEGKLYRITSIAGNVRRNEIQINTELVNE